MKIRTKSSLIRHIPVVHGGKNQFQNTDLQIIDFSSNISPIGIPSSIKKTLKKNIDKINNYPDFNSSGVILSLEKYTHLDKPNLLVGNGAIEIIYNFCNAFLSKKTKVLIPIPTFQEYETASKLNDCQISYFKTMDLSENIEQFISKIPKNGCIFICNPNNPTGKLLEKNQLLQIIKKAKKLSTLVFVDECFIDMVPKSNESVISYVKTFDNLFVLQSLTKSFALAGIRIGYAASSKYMINILQKIRIPWSVNTLAQEAAITALKNKTHLKKSNLIIKKELNYLTKEINKLNGFDCNKSSTNFILIKTKKDSTSLQKKLLKKQILIRDCKNFRGLNNHYVRIAVKSHKDNLKLVKALEKLK
ncbi:threonine-phosphate decarboxylase CobD [Nitrosopumilus sp.]|uniref:threonine-phosphate decarboxylase CobD n=1 Tax=Nitrosopumilus sp. TaxID=2024843 RepID=UPI00247B31CF|nr:threonine-phosphate decarboxylase CobD [Nitrosopumilus sp.]MCV0430976.1 threonine-phosphate decarboxylase CobD [Nitrosopumilus sp.]